MAFLRTVLIIAAMLIGWTALRHQGIAGSSSPAVATSAASNATIN